MDPTCPPDPLLPVIPPQRVWATLSPSQQQHVQQTLLRMCRELVLAPPCRPT